MSILFAIASTAMSVNSQSPAPRQPTSAQLLKRAGLRPTRQRLALASILFTGDRHVTAEELHSEALAQGCDLSLATVYNALHQFKDAGLLREVAVNGVKSYFDTNTSNHNHYFIEEQNRLFDIPADGITVQGLPEPPEGFRVSHIDVVVRLERQPKPRS